MLWFNRIVKNFDFAIIIARYHHVTWIRITFAIFCWIFAFLETWIGIEFRIATSVRLSNSVQSFRRWTWRLVQLIENQLWVRGKDWTSHQCIMRWKIAEHQTRNHATLQLNFNVNFFWDRSAKFQETFLVWNIVFKLETGQNFSCIIIIMLSHKKSDESWPTDAKCAINVVN